MLYKFIDINGKQYDLAVNQNGKGSPTSGTIGSVGVIYMDEDTGDLYKCTKITDGNYTWKPVIKAQDVSYPVIEMIRSEAQLIPNKYYKWGEVSNLIITLGPETPGLVNEYCFEFISGQTPTTVDFPASIKWISPLKVEPSKKYQISIVNGIGVIAGA